MADSADDADDLAFESPEHFWKELDNALSTPGDSHEHLDDALRSFLALTTRYKQDFAESEYDLARCCYSLLNSKIYQAHRDYVRHQLLYSLLQEDDVDVLHISAAFLLFDGRANESTFELLQAEGTFPRLVQLILGERDDENGMHKLFMELMFEMSRMQKLSRDDLVSVDDAFVLYLFQLIEQLSDDADDPYHYPIIRILLVLNEQYMCLANSTDSPGSAGPVTNRVLKLLSAHGPSYRTFGENLILLLNRESTLSAQLLILKLLYLLFTTPSTYEYFYTNDLHVLVDVIIRNLLDLDPSGSDGTIVDDGTERDGQRALRHTYLRVLCPLLKNTQLAREGNNYKREEVRKLLYLLVNRSSAHFAPVDETVIRLVIRCKEVAWLKEDGDEQDLELERKLAEVAPKEADVAKKLLGMSLDGAGVSSLSVIEVSAKAAKEKPSVPAPRRNRRKQINGGDSRPVGSSTNGSSATATLKPPPLAVPQNNGHDLDRTHSPFSDDNGET